MLRTKRTDDFAVAKIMGSKKLMGEEVCVCCVSCTRSCRALSPCECPILCGPLLPPPLHVGPARFVVASASCLCGVNPCLLPRLRSLCMARCCRMRPLLLEPLHLPPLVRRSPLLGLLQLALPPPPPPPPRSSGLLCEQSQVLASRWCCKLLPGCRCSTKFRLGVVGVRPCGMWLRDSPCRKWRAVCVCFHWLVVAGGSRVFVD